MGLGSRISDIIGDSEDTVDETELPDEPTVLVADDEKEMVELCSIWLGDDNNIRTAYSGQGALEEMSKEVDAVLLDRRMPEMSGDEVLEKMQDRGYECQVAMLTGVDPDVDIVDMPFDHYLTKPVDKNEVQEAVEKLLERSRLDKETRKRQTMRLKKVILEEEADDEQLEQSEEFSKLDRQLNMLEHGETANNEIDDFFG